MRGAYGRPRTAVVLRLAISSGDKLTIVPDFFTSGVCMTLTPVAYTYAP